MIGVIVVMGALGGAIEALYLEKVSAEGLVLVSGALLAALGALAGWAIVFAAWGPPSGLVHDDPVRRDMGGTPDKPGAVEIYQSTLMHIWSDGVVTLKEAKTLTSLRKKLGISDEQARRLEDDVKDVLFGEETKP